MSDAIRTDAAATEGCAAVTGYAGKLHKAPTSYSGGTRTAKMPVLLYRNGDVERVQTTPAFGGLLVVDRRDNPLVFHVGKWASDRGFPKLRWVDAHSAEVSDRRTENSQSSTRAPGGSEH